MGALKQDVFRSNVVVDDELNIIAADSSFYRFSNRTTVKGLYEHLEESDCERLIEAIKNNNTDIIVKFNVRNTIRECIIKIVKDDKKNRLCIYDFKGLISKYEKEALLNKKGIAILSLIDMLFFDFELSTCKVLISSGNYLEVIKEFYMKDIVKELAVYFNVQPDDYSLNSFNNDLKRKIYNKEYKIGTYNILTAPIFDDELNLSNIMGVMNKSNNIIKTREFYNLDGLTQILNKNTIVDLAMSHIGTLGNETALLIIDIDDFKDINDTYGHFFGDEVLIKIAKILKETVGDSGYVGRFGGDEFLVILNKTDEDSLRNILRNIKTAVQWAYSSEKRDFVLSCSMGCAKYPADASTYEDLFFLADKCLYLAKKKGKNCYVIYRKEKHEMVNVSQEEMHRNIINSLEINDSVDKFSKIVKEYKTVGVYKTLELVMEAIISNRVTIYEENKLGQIIGEKQTDDRIIDSSYYRFFNEKGILVNDNINKYEVVDKSFFSMYYQNGIVGSIEVKFESNNKEYLICFDKIGKENARAWLGTDVSFVLLVIDLLKEML